ncbi:hypothetical protein BC937DRAFT_95159 [Endogone sp. FLAS-F59071]|nr:hypothetical protein BC937DRAFT_95159 [Endogone sp. FLAS-F59071]|eukprot:RUS20458.1 hypothetical protein BC937DRAFT_95159 [Endogone sp. FLAS-F59071]
MSRRRGHRRGYETCGRRGEGGGKCNVGLPIRVSGRYHHLRNQSPDDHHFPPCLCSLPQHQHYHFPLFPPPPPSPPPPPPPPPPPFHHLHPLRHPASFRISPSIPPAYQTHGFLLPYSPSSA